MKSAILGSVLGIVASLAPVVLSLHAGDPFTNGLVAYYPFDGDATDASGNGNDGTVNSATPCSDRFGRTNSAFYFAGTPQSKITINSTNLLLQPPFSLSLWVNYMGGTQNPRLFSNYGCTLALFWPGATRPLAFGNTTTSGNYDCLSDGTFTQGTWHHVVAIRSTNSLVMYIDGQQQQNVVTVVDPLVFPSGLGTDWLPSIGGSGVIGYPYDLFVGQIDDVRFYNRVLSTDDVTYLYHYQSGPHLPHIITPPHGTVGYWGGSVQFEVEAEGSPEPGYLWYKDGFPIQWATDSTLSLSNLDFSDAGNYTVVVSNGEGSVTSAPPALLVVNPAGVSIGLYPFLTIEGTVGKSFGIQYTTDVSQTNSWISLTNFTLTQPVQVWTDTSVDASPGHDPKRFYRVVAVP